MIAIQSMSNADYCLLYRNVGSAPQYFNEDDRPTEPKKKVDPKSFERVHECLKSGKYDGIALIKDGHVVEHLPGGKPAAPVFPHDAPRADASPSVQPESAPADTSQAATDAGASARFTCLRYAQTIGKLFYFDNQGMLQRHTVASGANSTAHIVSCATIEDLEQAFRSATASDIFVGGLPPSDGVVVTSKAKRGEGKIARSKDDFVFCAAPGVMFIDNDHPVGRGDNQFEVYARVVPSLASASYVYAPSSSAFIVNAETGEILKGAGGQHYAIPVEDASDIPRALEALHQRMVLAGYGKAIVSDAGNALIRSPVDKALRTPNQPLFQRVSLAPGLVQHKEAHIGSHQGESFLFDTRLIHDLNQEEMARLTAIEQKLRECVADEVNDVRGAWIEARVQKVAESNSVEREVAAQYLRVILTKGGPTTRYDLIPGILIRFSSEWVDVRELLANPGKYDGKPCADPIEPDYGSGIGVAKFYENAKTGKPTINSNAHGGQVFFLHHDPKEIDLGGILSQGVKTHSNPGSPMFGAPQAAGSPLPAPDGGSQKVDWLALLKQATPPLPSFEFVPAGDLVREPQPVKYLVDELIEHPSLMMLFGAPSAGKSFVAISMAASVATGHPWLGRDVQQGTVFYLAGEGHAGISRRLRAWEIETGISLDGAPLFVSKLPAQLMDDENAQMVEREIRALAEKHGSPVLIVIDTLARNMGSGDESSNADIGKFVAHIDGMRHRLGCTVQLVHHSGHLETERARGASALPAAMDASFQMEDKGGLRALTQKKSKESELAAPIPLTLKEVPIGWNDAKGREIRSAVIASAEGQEHATPKSKSLTSRQQEGLQSLCKAVVHQGAMAQQDGEWMGTHVESWRVEFYRTCTAEDKKKAFQRVRADLKTRGIVRIEFDICYVRQSEPGLIAHNLTAKMQVAGHGT